MNNHNAPSLAYALAYKTANRLKEPYVVYYDHELDVWGAWAFSLRSDLEKPAIEIKLTVLPEYDERPGCGWDAATIEEREVALLCAVHERYLEMPVLLTMQDGGTAWRWETWASR